MPFLPSLRQNAFRLLGIGLFWTLVGLAFASQLYLSNSLLGRTISWSQAIVYSLADWYTWALLSAPILWVARRFPPERSHPVRSIGIHLAAATGFSVIYCILRAAIGLTHSLWLGESISFAEILQPLLLRTFPFNLLIYGVILAVSHAIDYYRKYHERTVHSLELEKHLTEARLQSLLRQLKPHFLFNTLNGIASLMHSNVDAADRMLVRLSELLRFTMYHQGQALSPVRDEFAFLDKYLEIERIRFRDRLTVRTTVDPSCLELRIPSLIVQPLVENAIRHGIEPLTGPGLIELSCSRTGDVLLISVCDNGPGLPSQGGREGGIGISNTRARLLELYGDSHRFDLVPRPTGGLEARLSIPL